VSADLAVITLILIYIAFKLREIQQGLAELKKIREEISPEYEKLPAGGLKLTSWGLKGIGEGIRSDLKEILEEISSEFEKSPSGLKLTKWGLKEIGEGIRSDLKEIQEEIRSK
jgi:hypothetical protein